MNQDQDRELPDVSEWLEDISATEESANDGVLVEEEVVIDVAM